MKLSSVLRILLIILGHRSQRVGCILSCVWFSSELDCSENVLKMLIQAPGNLLLCFAVELGFFLRDDPTPFTTTVAAGPATAECKQHRISTLLMLAPHPADRGCVVVCVVFKPSWC